MARWLMAVDRVERHPEAEATFRGQVVIMGMKGRETIFGGCCTRCIISKK
jgi:hypothetical protein